MNISMYMNIYLVSHNLSAKIPQREGVEGLTLYINLCMYTIQWGLVYLSLDWQGSSLFCLIIHDSKLTLSNEAVDRFNGKHTRT